MRHGVKKACSIALAAISISFPMSAQTTSANSMDKVRSGGRYFPERAFDATDPFRSDVIAAGVTKYLQNLNEPSMLEATKNRNITSYRLIRRDYPSGQGVMLHFTVGDSEGARVKVIVTSSDGSILVNRTEVLSPSDVEGMLLEVEHSDFWSMPPSEVVEFPLIKDGSVWTMEGVSEGSYHVVYRRNPKPSRYTELGKYFAKNLARLDDPLFSVRPTH